MTTAAKPLPPHGTDARYKGAKNRKPCRCTNCTRAHRHADIQRELRLRRGERNRIPVDEVLPHILKLRASGMSQTMIAREARVSQSCISYITTGRNKAVQTEKARRILTVQPRRFAGNAARPAIGSTRRVRALYSLGHSRADIAALSGLSIASISILAEGRWKVIDNLAATALDDAYRQLAHQRGRNWKNERRAAAESWPGPLAWDDIDDPAAHPDWTGFCGTDRGYWVHQLKKLPMCARCTTAHDEWLADHAHLDGRQRAKAMFTARSNAMAREADLAADARELLQLRVGLDQAAARLGVTREYLQQALRRHPNTTQEVAA